jgi:ubiquinone/menaquinone biosynthesis C-methylase UbiE
MASDNNDGAYTAELYNKTASFVYSHQFTTPILELLSAQPGEHIIDFGCGSAEITLALRDNVGNQGVVVGVDASQSMVSPGALFACCDIGLPV